ncbi:MOSC domain-containing protein [Candidatus Omnitrophota bacterium]
MASTEGNQGNGRIFSINCSAKKGITKTAIKESNLIEDFGLEEDAHGGPGIRQVSLLAVESIRKQLECPKVKDKNISLKPGDFAENITTEGVDLKGLKIKDKLRIETEIILEISKIGKECHRHCAIYQKIGDCIMPREGIFAKVIKGGKIYVGDNIEVVKDV